MYPLIIMLAMIPIYIKRLVSGPTMWDRVHATSLISVKILLTIILYASMEDTGYLLDLAVVFALLGFIGVTFTAVFLLERIRSGGVR